MEYFCQKMTGENVFSILNKAEKSFTPSLSHNIPYTLEEYAEKLSTNAMFVICKKNDEIIGFLAYYVNSEGLFAYIPQIWVSDNYQRKGIGGSMMKTMIENVPLQMTSIRLEVRKNNEKAILFYIKAGYHIVKEEKNKYLMEKRIRTKNTDEQ